MGREYPRVERDKYHAWNTKGKRRRCALSGCGQQARYVAEVQWSWFRGEDTVFHLCEGHGKKYSGAPSVPNPAWLSDQRVIELAADLERAAEEREREREAAKAELGRGEGAGHAP